MASVSVMVIAALWFGSAKAQHIANSLTQEDIVLLPEYCRYSQTINERFGNKEGREYWNKRLGDDFKHIHHYCWALASIRRSEKLSEKRNRHALLTTAVSDCEYVIRAAKTSFVLMPDVLIARGIAQGRLGRMREAEIDFKTAQGLEPRHVAIYVAWAGLLVSQGLKADARRVIEEGLKNVPDSPALARMAKDLS